ncbi:MAG: TolC family protein [Candidatus Eremiobacterota bacterium]
MTADRAVQVALLANPTVQALYRQVDISQAELDQASLLVNPVFEASVRFPNQAGHPANTEFALSWNLLDLLRRADREELASTRLRQSRLEVQERLLEVTREVKHSFYHVQALQQTVEQLEIILRAFEAATELYGRQHRAGNISDLDLAQQEAEVIAARIQLEQTRALLEQARIQLNLMLGQAPDRELKFGMLADLPEREVAAEGLEELALNRRPDLHLARLEVEADRQSMALSSGGLLDEVAIGVSREVEADPDHLAVIGPAVEFPVPIFDRKQYEAESFRVKGEQSQRLVEARQLQVRAEVRVLHSRLLAMRLKVERLRDQLIPKRRQILRLSRPFYDAMLTGVYTLLEFRREVASTRLELIEATEEYWSLRAELEQAVGGPLPDPMERKP